MVDRTKVRKGPKHIDHAGSGSRVSLEHREAADRRLLCHLSRVLDIRRPGMVTFTF